MKSPKSYMYILFVIFLATAFFRVALAYQTPTLDHDAYFVLRQAEHITQTGIPLYNDSLSYQGRQFLFAPFFYYLVALLTVFFTPIIIGKVLLNILAASIVFIVYLIAHNLTRNKSLALICAFFSGFVPAYFALTLNNLSIYTFVVPLFLLILYFLLNVKKPRYITYLLISLLVMVFTHPIIYVFVLALGIHILLQRTQSFSIKKADLELLLFVTFLVVWLNFILYKKAFLFHGLSIIWQNIPAGLMANYFTELTFLQAIYLIGFIPLLLGVFSAYHVLFKQKKKSTTLVLSVALAFFMLLLFKMMTLEIGFIFLSIMLVILSARGFQHINEYFQQTKFKWFTTPLFILIILLFIFTSVFQAFISSEDVTQNSPTQGDIDALLYLRDSSSTHATILAPIEEGDRKSVV